MKSYEIVYGEQKQVSVRVRELLAEGWTLAGGVSVAAQSNPTKPGAYIAVFAQALVIDDDAVSGVVRRELKKPAVPKGD